MTTAAIREKLYDFIRIAEDEKVKAIYIMLEDTIAADTEWWKDKAFTNDLDERYMNYKNGKETAYSLKEVEESIEVLRQKRKAK